MAERRLLKELSQLNKTAARETNHQVVELRPVDEENSLFEWEATIAKPTEEDSEYYFHGQWKLLISVGREYPMKPPTIRFSRDTPINHPNINFETGEICLDILKQENWSPAWNLSYLVIAILMLLDDPEPDSPLNIDMANLYRHDKAAYKGLVQYTIWKYNTFYDGPDSVEKRSSSGAKGYTKTMEDETLNYNDHNDTHASYIGNRESDTSFSKTPAIHLNETANANLVKGEIPTEINIYVNVAQSNNNNNNSNNNNNNYKDSQNFKVIHDVEEEVTKQFIAKVNEIGNYHSAANSADASSDEDLDLVRQQVSQAVSKQVEHIGSFNDNQRAPGSQSTNGPGSDENVERVKRKFLKQVNDRVNEVRRMQGQEADENHFSRT